MKKAVWLASVLGLTVASWATLSTVDVSVENSTYASERGDDNNDQIARRGRGGSSGSAGSSGSSVFTLTASRYEKSFAGDRIDRQDGGVVLARGT